MQELYELKAMEKRKSIQLKLKVKATLKNYEMSLLKNML
jgi:hypothetical protein